MIKTRGTIRPGGGYVQHYHGDLHIHGVREFAVDTEAAADVDPPAQKDKDGKDKPRGAFVFTARTYAELQEKNGSSVILEPIGGIDGELERVRAGLVAAQARIADLEQQLAAKSPKKPAA